MDDLQHEGLELELGPIAWAALTAEARDAIIAALCDPASWRDGQPRPLLPQPRSHAALCRLFSALFDAPFTGVALCDPCGDILAVSARLLEFLGCGELDVIGRSVGGTLGRWRPVPEHRVRLGEGLVAAVRSGQRWRGQITAQTLEGELSCSEVGLTPVVDEHGHVEAILAEFCDQTRLHASEERFELAVEGSTDGFWDWDLRAGSAFFSPRFRELLGYAPDDLDFDENPWEMLHRVHPEDRERTRTTMQATLRSGVPWSVEHRLQLHGGDYCWFRTRAVALRDAHSGVIVRVAGSLSDISDYKRTEAALRRSEAVFHGAFRASPNAIALLSVDRHRIVEVNDGFERILGYSRDEVVGRTVDELGALHEEQRLAARAWIAEHGVLRGFEMQLGTASGTLVDCLVSAERMELDGEAYLVAVAQDISEVRRLETQLRHAQRMESIGRLAGGIAHDFNNLLTAILGYSELLEADLCDEPDRLADLLEIRRAGERARALTSQLLAFARKSVVAPRRVDVVGLVQGMARLLQRVLGEDVTLALELPAGDAVSHVDPVQVEQVLLNLAVNARDAMPDGGRLRIALGVRELDRDFVATRPAMQPGAYVELDVQDTGQGMTQETLARIFEPFFTTKPVGQGTGLGLSVCYGIVTQAGGHIEADSQPGRGTTFRVFLPQHAAAAAPARS